MTPGFEIVAFCPAGFGASLARATLRAGGVALLDLTTGDGAALASVLAELPPDAPLALRVCPTTAALADRFIGRPHRLIWSCWLPDDLLAWLTRLQCPRREVWLEATGCDDLRQVDESLPFAGWLGRGSECGGRSGRQSTFILGQALARQSRPFWLQGGIGLHSASACRVLGATGVVLDDVLLMLRDAGLPARWQPALAGLGDDTTVVGAEWNEPWRFASRRELAGSRKCIDLAARIAEAVPPGDRPAAWHTAAAAQIGWGDPTTRAWPVGQLGGRAAEFAARFGTAGRLLRAVRESVDERITIVAQQAPLAEGAPLARLHGSRYPIVQGPMTRVTDTVPFARDVGQAGALPMLALAMMGGSFLRTLLDEAKTGLAGLPWGVGLLGYNSPDLLNTQLAAVADARPTIALIAGGRPDQAARLEALGIPTYIHVPSPELLRLFLESGARRFVFEGAECGGHVGPLNSLPLWDAMADVLASWAGDRLQVLLAGGIHDARSSAAAVAALAAPLAQRAIDIGVLMGSAYLFTEEAVRSGTVVRGFQNAALSSRVTTLIETRPGHRIRCMPSPFVERFAAHRKELIGSGCPPGEISDRLEASITGRMRIASKALAREGDHLRPLEEEHCRTEGLFMMGDLAILRETTQSCADLHCDVSDGATRLLAGFAEDAAPAVRAPRVASGPPVAIIGIGCLLPGAHEPETLWRNLLDRVELTEVIAPERWDWRLYYDPDPAARDRVVSKWGCFIKPLAFDPMRYGIPPKSLDSICLPQLLALEASHRAIADAGAMASLADPLLRERTAVIFGVGNAGDLEQMFKARTALPLIGPVGEEQLTRLPEWTEEAYPGILLNVVAGRVANRFDFGGPNFTVDAACASSLAALDLAVRELQSGRSDLALAGAVDAELSPHAFTAFSKTRALSPTGKARPFDEAADGIVLSEGAVVLVLKRLAEAERDGDRIYAVIRGVGGSSDGKGMGLTAPKPAGQIKAIERAHQAAGTDLASLGYYEAHATGTKVGDRAELETLTSVLSRAGAASGSCAVGAAKSLIGHTRSTAGLVGTVKAALALHHRVLPPHAGVAAPLGPLRDPAAPVYLPAVPLPWLQQEAVPRRAGVSAFGFGGTNFHAVLEEHVDGGPGGAAQWPAELIALAGANRDELLQRIDRLLGISERIDAGLTLRDVAFSSVVTAADRGPFRFAVAVGSADELRRRLIDARGQLSSGEPMPGGADWREKSAAGELAFVFPGQGSQYPFMGAELALYFPEMACAFDGLPVRDLVLPRIATAAEDRATAERALAATDVAQPAIAAISCGLLDLARRAGLRPSRVAGHSFGEFVALHAAGVLDRDDLLRLAVERGRLMAAVGAGAGTMAAVALDRGELGRFIDGADDLWIANLNSPQQFVVSGTTAAIERLLARLDEHGHVARRLPVGAGFHSPLVTAAAAPFAGFLDGGVRFASPILPVHSGFDGNAYPEQRLDLLRVCAAHMERPVDFTAQIEAMWSAGVRCFLELGPGRALTGLIGQILGDRPHVAAAADGGVRGWLGALARLWTHGQEVDLDTCFASRPVRLLDFDRLPEPLASPGWLIDGGRLRRAGEAGMIGTAPFLDADSEPVSFSTNAVDSTAAIYGEYQETMRRFLEQQENVLSRLLHPSRPGSDPVATPAAVIPIAPIALPFEAAPTPETTTLDYASLTVSLLRLVSERTGYPLDILRPDQDLEAELGVDSLKRIEIIGRLIKSQPSAVAERLQQSFELLVAAKSADALIRSVLLTASSVDSPTQPAAVSPCPRALMRPIAKRLPEGIRSLSGLYLVTAGGGALAEDVAAGLRSHGAIARVLQSTDTEGFANQVEALRVAHGPVHGIVHLGPLDDLAVENRFEAWRAATRSATKNLFELLQACGNEMADAAERLRVVSVSRMHSPASGGPGGLLRSVAQEFQNLLVKVVDFDDAHPLLRMADDIVREVLNPGGGDDIGYRSGERCFFHAAAAEFDAAPDSGDWRPREGWVVLATGGARGITAEVVSELARPGVRLVLVGRSEGDVSGERGANIERFRRSGAHVEYHALDVRSEPEFGGLIDDLYRRYGRIDAVLHGAGTIEDQRLAQKSFDSFERVFDSKADGGFILSQHLRADGLKWVVLFGSVSGRFGNIGQADYAAANETLARLGHWMNARWPATRVVTLHWGPWSRVGMTSEGVQRLLAAKGITPIEPESGRQFFVAELSRGRKADAEVIAGYGPWHREPDQHLTSVFASLMTLFGLGDMDRLRASQTASP